MRAFLSSTKADLEDHRTAVYDRVNDQHEVLRMEDFGSTDSSPLEYCLGLIETAEVVVVLVGYGYGSRAPGTGLSFTEAEYEHAKSRGIPVLPFIRDDFDAQVEQSGQSPADKDSIRAFRETVEREQIVRRPYFSSPGELASQVELDLRSLERNGTVRPTFGRAEGAIRRPREYARGEIRREQFSAIAYPITLVNLATLDLARFPGENGGRLVRKLLDVEVLLREKALQVTLFNEVRPPTGGADAQTVQRLRFVKRNSELIVCFSRSTEDLLRLLEFKEVRNRVGVWHPEGTQLPADFGTPLFARTYTQDDLDRCRLRVEAFSQAMDLASSRLLAAFAA